MGNQAWNFNQAWNSSTGFIAVKWLPLTVALETASFHTIGMGTNLGNFINVREAV